MCRFKSGIILKDRVKIAEGDNDSHSDLLDEMGIEDSYLNATKTFVRAELVPSNGEWWISPISSPEEWKFIVDQDIVPDWFGKGFYETKFRAAVCAWWSDHVLIDQKVDTLSAGYYRLKRCEVKKLINNVRVSLDSSQVGGMWGRSQVGEMYDSSQVGTMHDSSQVGVMRDSSQVGVMRDSSQVGVMRDSSQVGVMRDSSQVGEMYDSSQVGEMYGGSQVGKMHGGSQVGAMWGSSQVGKMRGSSTARVFKQYPKATILVGNGEFEMVVHKDYKQE